MSYNSFSPWIVKFRNCAYDVGCSNLDAIAEFMNHHHSCPICGNNAGRGLDPWHFVCPACGYEFSDLKPEIRSGESEIEIDERIREVALKDLRQRNFRSLIDKLAACGLRPGASVLDVGCAHGWFLQALTESGYKASGIEPDRGMAEIAKAQKLHVYEGFFPGDLPQGSTFDAITFNDVLEHLPNVKPIVQHCADQLKPGGLLLVNSPNTSGAFYRLARLTRRAGMRKFWDRMWQKGLPSPHLSYFSSESLLKVGQDAGFSTVARFPIPADQLAGSWQRIRYTGMSVPVAAIVWGVLFFARPVISMLPSDTLVFVFKKTG